MDGEYACFFNRMPGTLDLFSCLRCCILERFGQTGINVRKSQIDFCQKRSFASVWLPISRIKGRPKKYIVLTFYLGHRIESPRIVQTIEPYPNRFTHHLLISGRQEIDEELLDWLSQSLLFSLR
jgi:hypothetical protein